MNTQAQAFYDVLQEQLKHEDFQGIMFSDGAVLPASQLRKITDPEALISLVSQIAEQTLDMGIGNN